MNQTRIWTSVICCILVAILSEACGRSPARRTARFNEAEFAPFAREGTGTLIGQAFVRTIGGDVKYAAGLPVYLVPVTSYTNEWFKRTVREGTELAKPDPRFVRYERMTLGDGEGRFKFEKVPPGQYFVVSQVSWMYVNIFGLLSRTTEYAAAKAEIGDGEKVEVIASSN